MTDRDVVKAAEAAGIPVVLLLALGIAESNLTPTAERGTTAQRTLGRRLRAKTGTSFRTSSTTSRGAAARIRGHLLAEVGLSPDDPSILLADDDYLLRALYRYNWPAGNGEPKSAAIAANYRRGLTEAKALLDTGEESILAQNPDIGPWEARWRAVRPNAVYYHDRGFETWWRSAVKAHLDDPENSPDPGYPLTDDEESYVYGGQEYAGRVFSKAGLMEWKSADYQPWPPTHAGGDRSGWPN